MNDPESKPRVSVSYSWEEERNGSNAGAVAAFCSYLQQIGVDVVRDTDRLRHGECISQFMVGLGASDFLCVFLSDAYLRSPNCMYELLVAWNRSKAEPDKLRQRVKVWAMPGSASIASIANRLEYTKYWRSERDKVGASIEELATDGLGPADLEEFRRIKAFAEHVNGMLSFFADTLSPYSLENYRDWIHSQLPTSPFPFGGTTNIAPIAGTAASPDGEQIATGHWDGFVRLWRRDGRLRHAYHVHNSIVWSLRFHPTEPWLATASQDGSVAVLNYKRNYVEFRGDDNGGFLTSIDWTRDGAWLISGGHDGVVRLWDVATGDRGSPPSKRTRAGHQGQIHCVRVHPSGDFAVSAGGAGDGSLRRCTLPGGAGRPMASKKVWSNARAILCLDFSPDGSLLALVDASGTLRVMKPDGDQVEVLSEVSAHGDEASSVCFCNDYIATGSHNGQIAIWQLQDRTLVRHRLIEGNKRRLHSVSYARKGGVIIGGGDDPVARGWPIDGTQCIEFAEATASTISSMVIDGNGELFYSTAKGDLFTVFRRPAGGIVKEYGPWKLRDAPVTALAVSSASARIATASNGSINVYDCGGGRSEPQFEAGTVYAQTADSAVAGIALSADGTLLAYSIDDGSIFYVGLTESELRHVPLPQLLREWVGCRSVVGFGPDGTLACATYPTGGGRSIVEIRQKAGRGWRFFKQASANDSMVNGIAVARVANSTFVATAGGDHRVLFWDTKNDAPSVLHKHNGMVRCVAISPNCDSIASGGDDGLVIVSMRGGESGSKTKQCSSPVLAIGYETEQARHCGHRGWISLRL